MPVLLSRKTVNRINRASTLEDLASWNSRITKGKKDSIVPPYTESEVVFRGAKKGRTAFLLGNILTRVKMGDTLLCVDNNNTGGKFTRGEFYTVHKNTFGNIHIFDNQGYPSFKARKALFIRA